MSSESWACKKTVSIADEVNLKEGAYEGRNGGYWVYTGGETSGLGWTEK
jgi:hypothetical protein